MKKIKRIFNVSESRFQYTCFLSALTICLGMSTACFGVGSREVFQKYHNACFIETGTYKGSGVSQALHAGYETVYSIELSPELFRECTEKFQNDKCVHLFQGDSSVVLPKILQDVNQRCTFWLDGHFSSGETAKGDLYTPLIQELLAIKNHPIKTHTILIDDIRLLKTKEMEFITLKELITIIYSINPDYIITFEDGYSPDDILVAYVPE